MATGTKPNKERKRRAVVAGVLAGKSLADIAEEAGCGKRHAQRLRAEPETQLLITDLMRPYHAALERLVPRVIRAINRGLTAQKTTRSDLPVQLLAVRRAKDVLLLAQGTVASAPASAATPGTTTTWEEIKVRYRKYAEEEQRDAA